MEITDGRKNSNALPKSIDLSSQLHHKRHCVDSWQAISHNNMYIDQWWGKNNLKLLVHRPRLIKCVGSREGHYTVLASGVPHMRRPVYSLAEIVHLVYKVQLI